MSERGVPLEIDGVNANPFEQFQLWFAEASGLMAEREAVALATATREGVPSVRMVLMRHHDGQSFGWYTNYDSSKGRDLAANPRAALLWYCEALGRQIRIEGSVEKMSDAQSDEYFSTRQRGSQLGAHASHQSQPLASREKLDQRVHELATRYEGRDVPRPSFWGGYLLTPERFEFWQHRENRLHDRIAYWPDGPFWRRERLSP
ncbi:MAG: Pyridoxamine 5-phosphate oxidase [Acidimicrobiaceae bacterium]|nr:Pyridoxamine 5-phosphate oxidase [Acidimicrobiaceae bacterium]